MVKKIWAGGWRLLVLLSTVLLGGCSSRDFWLFDAKGVISQTQVHYMVIDVVVMLIIIIPTALLIMWAMWRYRKSAGATYSPHWSHSNAIEAVVWGIPIITVAVLSYYSVKAIYQVNPYEPTVLASAEAAPAQRPLEVDVIATDWRWVFIYPAQHIMSVGKLVIPVDRPVKFRLTSTSVTNDFYIPQLVGMIDVMPGMRVKQALMANHVGTYEGFSANYSGAGFSWMNFQTDVVPSAQFQQWTKQIQQTPQHMDYAQFNLFAKPDISVSGKPEYFSDVEPGLFDHVVGEVMSGRVWPTPMDMTENMVKYLQKQRARQAQMQGEL